MRVLARRAAERYDVGDRYARHFAFGKLKGDPVFAHILRAGLVRDGATILDLGCGQGLLGALLEAAREQHARGEWPGDWAPPPTVFAIRGIELAAPDVARARTAVDGAARYLAGDIRTVDFGTADVAVLLDVVHYIERESHEAVLKSVRAALSRGGLLLARVANADGSWRFRITEAADKLAMAMRGRCVGALHSRPLSEWRSLLTGIGFDVDTAAMSEGTPFANALLIARYHPAKS